MVLKFSVFTSMEFFVLLGTKLLGLAYPRKPIVLLTVIKISFQIELENFGLQNSVKVEHRYI